MFHVEHSLPDAEAFEKSIEHIFDPSATGNPVEDGPHFPDELRGYQWIDFFRCAAQQLLRLPQRNAVAGVQDRVSFLRKQ